MLSEGSGLAGRFDLRELLALNLKLAHVERAEIDRLEHERRETAVAHGIREDTAREGEQDARRFRQQEGLELLIGNITQPEKATIGKLDLEGDLVGRFRAN